MRPRSRMQSADTMNTGLPQPSYAVDRASLRARLDDAMTAPLTLLIAPAGSGKTVLLSQWADSRPDARFVWLGVEESDNDPAQFLRRLVGALTAVAPAAPDLGPLLSIGAGGFGRPALESLVALLGESPATVIVFDDLHHLSNRAIIDNLWWLADHLPPHMHIVFSSRVDLCLDWSRHRLRYALLELRQADLAFDSAVVAEVLHRIAGTAATPATVSAVLEITEGWAAGVQLTAISLRHQRDPEQFAQRLAGTDRLISDYLSEEVLGAQTKKRRDVLLRMSALETMSASLVESVLGVPDAASLFEELQRESMFLVPLDHQQEWFRFHNLFRDLLQYRLRAHHPDEERRILIAAARWHEERGDLASAIECCLRAHAWEHAMDLILAHGREVFERGHAASISRWLSIVPEQDRVARPLAEVMYGYTLAVTGEAARSEDVLRQLTTRSDQPGVALIAHAFLASLTQFRPSVAVSIETAREAVRVLHENADVDVPPLMGLTHPTLLETLALGGLGRAHFLAGDLTQARQWLEATEQSPGAQYSGYRIHLLGAMALLEAWSGRLKRAELLADEGLEIAREVRLLVHPAAADAYLAKALVAIHRGRPQSGGHVLREGALRAASNRRVPLMWIAHLESVLAEGTPQRGAPALVGAPPPVVRQSLDAAALRARRLRRQGGTPAVAPFTSPTTAWTALLVEAVASALAARRTDEARALLAGARFVPREDTPIATVEHGVLTAWLAHLDGHQSESRARLSAAVELAGLHGLVSVFLWAGPEVIRLVEGLPGLPDAFRTELLARAHERLRPVAAVSELAEPLTYRELQLLAYLPSRLTNAELAGRLFVSVNTVKTHTAHIYRKLNVPNRSAAVARASELGLL